MTDLEKMLEMLTRARIEYDVVSTEPLVNNGITTLVSVEYGYTGFVTEIYFDKKGDLVSIESYE